MVERKPLASRMGAARCLLAAALALGLLLCPVAWAQSPGSNPAVAPSGGGAVGASGGNGPPKPAPTAPAAPQPASDPILWIALTIAALAGLAGVGGFLFAVVLPRLRRQEKLLSELGRPGFTDGQETVSPSEGGPRWEGLADLRQDLLEVLGQIRDHAGRISQQDLTQQKKDWQAQLESATRELRAAQVSRADYKPLHALYVEVGKIASAIVERMEKDRSSGWAGPIQAAVLGVGETLQEKMKETHAPPAAAGAGDTDLRSRLLKFEERVEGLATQQRQLSERVASEIIPALPTERSSAGAKLVELERRLQDCEARPDTLGALLEAEFRRLCESRARRLEEELRRARPARPGAAAPPVVEAALRLGSAAERVTAQAVVDASLSGGVKAQLTNLTTVASMMKGASPCGGGSSAPTVDSIRALPGKPEARWNPDILVQADSVFEAQRMYWTRATGLLKTETGIVEQWLSRSGGDTGPQDAAVAAWLQQHVLPLADQAAAALDEHGEAHREARNSRNRALPEALQALGQALQALTRGTGLETFTCRQGDVQRPDARAQIEYRDERMEPHTVLEVRQAGWAWNGRILRKLDVVVQTDERRAPEPDAPAPASDPARNGHDPGGAPPPRPRMDV